MNKYLEAVYCVLWGFVQLKDNKVLEIEIIHSPFLSGTVLFPHIPLHKLTNIKQTTVLRSSMDQFYRDAVQWSLH